MTNSVNCGVLVPDIVSSQEYFEISKNSVVGKVPHENSASTSSSDEWFAAKSKTVKNHGTKTKIMKHSFGHTRSLMCGDCDCDYRIDDGRRFHFVVHTREF